MRVLFWNTNKNERINQVLYEIIIENNVTLAALAEYADDLAQLRGMLACAGVPMEEYVTIGCDRITIIGSIKDVNPSVQDSYSSTQIINEEIIVCCLHLPSKIFSTSNDARKIIANRIVENIKTVEKEIGSDKVIIVGDFNVNPFEDECIDATMFHGLPVFEVAKRKERTVAGQSFKMFYNPMWNFFGDHKKPYGTYYYAGGVSNNPFWSIYDQVIISPSLRDRFVDSSLKIITETNIRYLLDQYGHPDKEISDHLPIMFEIMEANYD